MARTSPTGPAETSRDRTLSAVLRSAAERAKRESGLSMRKLAERVDTSHSTLHRWLSGKGIPSYESVVSIVTALGITGDEKEAILEMARNPGPNWVATGPPGVSKELAGVMELERTAEAVTVWMPLFVPGMLQTHDYARAIIESESGGENSEAEVDHLVTLRMGRQNLIIRDKPITLQALIGVPAMHGQIGNREVMIGQLRHLERASEFAHVTIRLVPVDGNWHNGLLGPFVRYDFPKRPSIVYLEHHASGVFLDESHEVDAYRKLADILDGIAHSAEESRALIAEQINRWETT
ncbi:helix-turn-helix domain-containing protein [Amycolatopsis sp. CA-230715]|uniref:helix-turn-helix domain-containing protein n=1 Tax=Amycolatopsis sp. CA-230715 TaxID=2745196 RepID=UPI001C00B8EF|nr:helix-turn-helix transcriptional regulator [Amycolatopsis sp. CA-230715]QWF78854.1 hypothetical protein HUW46_02252 [Amycolatopsis sp. CA-230715]